MPSKQLVRAFTDEQVARLTGISARQLRYWDETKFFQPEYGWEERNAAFSRIYSYLDLVSLKVIARLRQDVPLQRLRVVKSKLSEFTPDLWRGLELWVDQNEVAFVHPATGKPEQVVSGQQVMKLSMDATVDDIDRKVEALFVRDTASLGKVTQKRRVMHNRPVILGTRIPVSAIKAFHEAGHSVDDILDEYPSLTKEDVRAALDSSAAA